MLKGGPPALLSKQDSCFKFLQKTEVDFILSDANGNTAQKLSMNSQFHRNYGKNMLSGEGRSPSQVT